MKRRELEQIEKKFRFTQIVIIAMLAVPKLFDAKAKSNSKRLGVNFFSQSALCVH